MQACPFPSEGAVQGHFSDRVFPGPPFIIKGVPKGGEFVIEGFNIFYHSSKNNSKTRISYNMICLIGAMQGGRSEKAEQLFVGLMQKFGPYGYQVDRELKMTGDNNKNVIRALLLSLLASITTFSRIMTIISSW